VQIYRRALTLQKLINLTKMSNANPSYWDDVYETTKRIPIGRVSTYGAIAEYLCLGSARMVGWALNHCHSEMGVPAHRVVNRIGELSGRHMFPNPTAMQERLEAEGIKVENDKIKDFKAKFWHPGEGFELKKNNTDEIIIDSLLGLDAVSTKIAELLVEYPIAFFQGEMGAGKTTTIKALVKHLGVNDFATSPTFSIVNEYRNSQNKTIYHMDLFRLKSLEEALDIGIEEYLDSGNVCLIEWPQIILPLIEKYLEINIIRMSDGKRSFNFIPTIV
jgi:tRNA threonylcarbamoyl adenosine modification protein YjeE